MRALIYTRVSHDPKKRGRSVAEQEADCRAVCAREGWDVVEVVTETDRSASRHAKRSRPEWERVKELIGSGGFDVLTTWEASRAQRDLGAYAELRELCAAAGVRWCYSGKVFDFADTDDRFRSGIDALISENEADKTRERVLRAMRANAAAGRPHGRLLYGYRRTYDPETREFIRQEPDPEQAPIIRELARRTLAGEPAYAIAADLTVRGITAPRGGRWHPTTIKRTLTNPHYTALRVHKGTVTGEGDWPALIDRDDFDRLAAIYADPDRAKFRRGRDVVHLLSGIARCGLCGARLYRGHDRGRGQYVCRVGKQHIARSQDHLDAYVTAIVVGILERGDLGSGIDDDPAQESARAEAERLRARLAAAVDEFTAGKLTASTLGRVEADLLPKIADAERRARPHPVPESVTNLTGPDAGALWDAASIDTRRQVVAELVDVTVNKSTFGPGRRGFDPSSVVVTPKL